MSLSTAEYRKAMGCFATGVTIITVDLDGESHGKNARAHFDPPAPGTPVLQGPLAYLEFRLESAQAAGDHTIFIAEVEDVVVRQGEPLLFFRGKYRKMGSGVAG